MPKEDPRLKPGTRVHAKATHVTNDREAEQMFARLFKASYFIGEVRSWRLQTCKRQKRKILEVEWGFGRKKRLKKLPIGLVKLENIPRL